MGTICAGAAVLVVRLATTATEPGIAADSEAMRRAGTAALVVLGVVTVLVTTLYVLRQRGRAAVLEAGTAGAPDAGATDDDATPESRLAPARRDAELAERLRRIEARRNDAPEP